MALVVEDGTGKSDAESYVSVADADAYHVARSQTGWAGTNAAKEALLRRATELLDASYAWRGTIATEAQGLRFPREGILDRDKREIAANEVPTAIVRACCELALLLLGGQGVGGGFGSTATATGTVRRVRAGSVEVEYADAGRVASPASPSNVLPDGAGELLDRILAGLYVAPGGPIPLGKS
jgi:hypothetical protein